MSDYPEPVDRTADTIDSRDIIARLEYLSVLRTPGPVEEGLLSDEDADMDQDTLFAELAELEELAREGEFNFADWQYGETLISNAYFEEYARDLAEDIGAIDRDAPWPLSFIDWEKAAEALLMDYTAVEIGGVTFWGRS